MHDIDKERIAYLDGWRGLAILFVLFNHFVTGKFVYTGRLGVDLFFVLSGRLMAEVLFVKGTPLKRFFYRRFSRIYPVLIIFCLGMLFLSLDSNDPSLPQFIASITLSANYLGPLIGRSEVLDHIWSLCVEEHLYIFLAIVAWSCKKYDLRPLPILLLFTGIFIINGLVLTWFGYDYAEVYWRSDVRGASILMGASAYLFFRERRFKTGWLPGALFLAGVSAYAHGVPDPIKHSLGASLLAISLVLLKDASPKILRLLRIRTLTWCGLLSYSLYLWQQPFYKAVLGIPAHLLVLPMTFAVGWASFRFIENPIREKLNAILYNREVGSRA